MNTSIYNKNGTISAYGFACGYVEKQKTNKEYKDMFCEHNHIHVISGVNGQMAHIRECFDAGELTKARKFYNGIKLNK